MVAAATTTAASTVTTPGLMRNTSANPGARPARLSGAAAPLAPAPRAPTAHRSAAPPTLGRPGSDLPSVRGAALAIPLTHIRAGRTPASAPAYAPPKSGMALFPGEPRHESADAG